MVLTGLGVVEGLQSGVESGYGADFYPCPHYRDHCGRGGCPSLHRGDEAPGLLRRLLAVRHGVRTHEAGIVSADGLACLLSGIVVFDSFHHDLALGSGHGPYPVLGRCRLCDGRDGHNRDPCLLGRSDLYGQRYREMIYHHAAKVYWIVPTFWRLQGSCGERGRKQKV